MRGLGLIVEGARPTRRKIAICVNPLNCSCARCSNVAY